jgi:hypothetical protein
MEIDNKLLIDKYYTALMLYLVYTFADKLLQGLISKICCLDLWIYTILWASLVIQTTFAYKHIMAIKKEAYTTWALVSDCIDISFSLFICAVISSTFRSGDYKELDNYILLYIIYVIITCHCEEPIARRRSNPAYSTISSYKSIQFGLFISINSSFFFRPPAFNCFSLDIA